MDDTGNLLLRSLPANEFALLAPHMERIAFSVDDGLARAGDPITSIYFPEAAIAAVLAPAQEGPRQLAVGLVGREGYIGWPLLLGDDRWPYEVIMRADRGTALRIDADAFLRIVDGHPDLRARLLRFANVFMMQMARTIVSSLVHPVERRMARAKSRLS